MKIELIDYTGKGSNDPWYAARLLVYTKNTRLEQGEGTRRMFETMKVEDVIEHLSYIANTIRSSWEFVDYTFEIRDVTRAFTHQLVRTRTASYAQQAQRVVDMSHFTAERPITVETAGEDAVDCWNNVIATIQQGYSALRGAGIPSQDCRGLLPTNVHTNIIMKANLRTIADMVGKRQNLRAQGEFGSVMSGIAAHILEVHPWALDFLYPERTTTPALDELMSELLGDGSPIDKPRINAALKELDNLKGTWG